MGEAAVWIGIVLTVVALVAGGVAYVQGQIRQSEDRADRKMEAMETRHKADLDDERGARREAVARVEKTLEGFASVASAVLTMGKSIEHLAERFTDHQRNTERAMDELKHTVRNVDQKVSGLSKTGYSRSRVKGTQQ